MIRTKFLFQLFLILGTVFSVACDGGGGSPSAPNPTPTQQKLSGTAAAGAPIIGRVIVKDSAGVTRTAQIDANGGYTVDVTGLTPPFLLRAEGVAGGRSYVVHSAATSADVNGTINITPLTDLIVANVARQVAANYFDSGNFSTLGASALNAEENTLQQRLQAVLTDLGVADSIDLLRSAFSADHTGVDAALDVLRVSVDTATNTALITNVINNANITDDLTLSSDSSLLDSTGTASGLSDWDAIRARLASFEAAFATGLPAANDPLLLAQFDQAGFLQDGDDLATFLGDRTTEPEMVRFRFISVSLVSLTPATTGQNGRAVVTLGVGAGDYTDWTVTGIYNNTTGGTNWLLAGDQRIAEVYAGPRSILGFDSSNRTQIQSGINFYIGENPTGNIDYAVVTGPGMPATGGGASGTSAGLLLVSRGFGDSFDVASPPYAGTSTPTHPRAADNGHMYVWEDGEIAALPSDNLAYSVTFYDDHGTPSKLADDTPLATYPFTLLKPPLPASSLSAANFPVITAPTASDVLGIYATGGPLTVTWNLPAGLEADEFESLRFYNVGLGGGFDSVEDEISRTASGVTSTTVQITPPPGTATGGWLTVTAADAASRAYSYRLHVP